MRRSTEPGAADRYEPPDDLEHAALEYVAKHDDPRTSQHEAARELVHAAAAKMLGTSPVPQSENQAKSRLIEAIRADGSRRVFRQAYEEHFAAWKRSVLAMAGNDAFAEDVVQDAVCATLKARPNFTAVAAVNGYVRRAIRSVLRDSLFGKPRQLSLDDEVEAFPEPAGDEPSPQRAAWRHERAELLRQAFREAPPEEQEAYKLHYLSEPEWTLDAVAEKQGVTPRAVSKRIARLRERLQAVVGR